MEDRITEDIIRQYLISHNYTGTLDAFDAECRRERTRHRFQPSIIVTDLLSAIYESNWESLVEQWHSLQNTFFSRLDTDRLLAVQALKVHVFKTYVTHAFGQKRSAKVTEFFAKLSSEFRPDSPEWRGWFALPYMQDVSEDPVFAMYFTKSWLDILSLSLNNFLSILLHADLSSSNVLHRLDLLENEVKNLRSMTACSTLPSKTIYAPPYGKLLDDFNELGSIRSSTK